MTALDIATNIFALIGVGCTAIIARALIEAYREDEKMSDLSGARLAAEEFVNDKNVGALASGVVKLCDRADREITALRAEVERYHWISIEDRLPEMKNQDSGEMVVMERKVKPVIYSDYVDVALNGAGAIDRDRLVRFADGSGSPHWYLHGARVTHWRPITLPTQQETEE